MNLACPHCGGEPELRIDDAALIRCADCKNVAPESDWELDDFE